MKQYWDGDFLHGYIFHTWCRFVTNYIQKRLEWELRVQPRVITVGNKAKFVENKSKLIYKTHSTSSNIFMLP